jgi:hypothetical protein
LFTATLFFDLQPTYTIFFFAGLMTMALVIIVAASSVPLLTPAGEASRQQWLAFQRYLGDARTLGYVEGAQAYYQYYLPYAIVLQQEVAWARRFRDYPFMLPEWYDSTIETLSIEDFANSIYTIIGSVSHLFSSSKEPTVQ